ncbi:FkbM family methyltransferase [Pseudolabrys taiwanensis]|uniref:FkbM family methyltransferase n=1 Tax=Pseudolabrys taiwanensis TaxID=331696 RepID=A0A345ZQ61_9HYPH|nr:FkbM family methyltransferase [Pseudolabrys taiwanensis]AXK79058.1 FkbM family methyltransferase [Pseudolabrys taiwanensis]
MALKDFVSRFLGVRDLIAENKQLKAQLHNVGAELAVARSQLYILTQGNTPVSSLQTGSASREADAQLSRYQRRDELVLLPGILELLPQDDRFLVVDGGAREVDRDLRWRPFPPSRMKFVGFEPDQAEAARLNSTPGPGGIEWQFVPAGLWGSSGTIKFEHNKAGGGSSFLPQNRSVTDRWKFENPHQISLAAEIFFPIGEEDMTVVSLADWSGQTGTTSIDFLKLNVQGAEHEILDGAGPLLDTVLGVLIEVAFVESYKDRPFFADTDRLLRQRGFTFFDLLAHHYIGRSASPIAAQHLKIMQPGVGQLTSSWGQLIEGHALYLRDPISDDNAAQLPLPRILKLAALAEAFGQVEYAFELLDWLKDRPDVKDTPIAQTLAGLIASATSKYKAMLRDDMRGAG